MPVHPLLLHEILNALAIARGLTEGVQSSLMGQLELTPEQKLEKLTRAIKAMDRIEVATEQLRQIRIQEDQES